jgi:hypothetical protein
MKPQLIQFTEHGPETLNHLIRLAKERGQEIKRGSDFLKFNMDEALSIPPTPPKIVKTVYGTKEQEKKVAPSTDHLMGLLGYGEG